MTKYEHYSSIHNNEVLQASPLPACFHLQTFRELGFRLVQPPLNLLFYVRFISELFTGTAVLQLSSALQGAAAVFTVITFLNKNTTWSMRQTIYYGFFLKKGVSIRRQEDIFPGSPVLPHESYKLYLFSINKTPVGFSFLGSCSMMTTQSHWCPAVFCHVSKKNGFWI